MHKPKSEKDRKEFLQLEIIQPYAIPDKEEEKEEEKPPVIEILKSPRKSGKKREKDDQRTESVKIDKKNDIDTEQSSGSRIEKNKKQATSDRASEYSDRIAYKNTINSTHTTLLSELKTTLRELIDFNENPLKTRLREAVNSSNSTSEQVSAIVSRKTDVSKSPETDQYTGSQTKKEPKLSLSIQEKSEAKDTVEDTLSEVVKRSLKNPNFFASSFKRESKESDDSDK